ncbi:MAG: hypothetical protein AAB460_01850 [Patescibacteria group bacterium]
MRITPRTLSGTAALLVSIAIIGYVLFEARGYLLGPRIEVVTPRNGDIVTDSLIYIEGRAERILGMTVNGRVMFVNDLGAFNEPVALLSGKNVITITATDRFGEVEIETILIFYRPETSFSISGEASSSTSTPEMATTTP